MIKTIILILPLILLSSGQSQLAFQTGQSFVSLSRNGSLFNGDLTINSVGGSPPYKYQFSGLPSGWSSVANKITIPNIVSIVGSFAIRGRVTDSRGISLEAELSLLVNGVTVQIQISNANSNSAKSKTSSQSINLSPSNTKINIGDSTRPQRFDKNNISSLYQNYPGTANNNNANPIDTKNTFGLTDKSLQSNIDVDLIKNSQAAYNLKRDGNSPTIDQVIRNNIFQRQLNANKAIANLLTIILQLTANVNSAKSSLNVAENELSTAQMATSDCAANVSQLENTIAKIQNAIKDREDKILQGQKVVNTLNPVIQKDVGQRDGLIVEKQKIEQQKFLNSQKLLIFNGQIKQCNSTRFATRNKISDINNQISTLNGDMVKQLQNPNAPNALQSVNQQLTAIDKKIADLKQQLEEAQNERVRILQEKTKYENQDSPIPNKKIRDIQLNIDILQKNISPLQIELQNTQDKCSKLQNQALDISGIVSQLQSNIKKMEIQIRAQGDKMSQSKQKYDNLKQAIPSYQEQVKYLRQQKSKFEQTLRRQTFACQDLSVKSSKLKQNVAALNEKFKTQSGWLRQANNNLEKARVEKEIVDLAVQQIIGTSTNGLPFVVIKNNEIDNSNINSTQNQTSTKTKTTPGNPVFTAELNSYLFQIFGQPIDETKPSTNVTIHLIGSLTFQVLTGQNLSGAFATDGTIIFDKINSQKNTKGGQTTLGSSLYRSGAIINGSLQSFSCSQINKFIKGEGRVIGVQPGLITIKQNNGSKLKLRVAPCSSLYSIEKNFSIVPQTRVFFRGVQIQQGEINLDQIICL